MSKHIWYRLEYKRATHRILKYFIWIGCTMLALAIVSIFIEPEGQLRILLETLIVGGAMSLLIGITAVYTLEAVDKYEWELTKKIKGGQTK